MNTYILTLKNESEALDLMRTKNRACRLAGNRRDLYAVVPGPEDDWSVVDIRTAIELGANYLWEA